MMEITAASITHKSPIRNLEYGLLISVWC